MSEPKNPTSQPEELSEEELREVAGGEAGSGMATGRRQYSPIKAETNPLTVNPKYEADIHEK